MSKQINTNNIPYHDNKKILGIITGVPRSLAFSSGTTTILLHGKHGNFIIEDWSKDSVQL